MTTSWEDIKKKEEASKNEGASKSEHTWQESVASLVYLTILLAILPAAARLGYELAAWSWGIFG